MTARVCVIGNFSGRNAGDAAILGGLMKDLDARFGPLSYDVPTIKPSFVREQYADFDVNPVGLLPWNLSVKIFGLPIVRSILRSDIVLVTDAILFDRKLLNPLYNYLSTMALVLPLAKANGIPVVLYNVSLGPAKSTLGRTCLRRVLNAADEIVLRDTESLTEIPPDGGFESRIRRGADCALSIDKPPEEEIDRILADENLPDSSGRFLTFNINSYIDVFVRDKGKQTGMQVFSEMMAAAINEVMRQIDTNLVLVVTQPMDMKITNMVLEGIEAKDRVRLVSNIVYSYAQLAGIFSRAEIHVGMRTHSLILASSVGTPVVGIIATPKNRGYMRSIKQDARMIEFDDLTSESLAQGVVQAWNERSAIRSDLAQIIAEEKRKAAAAAEFVAPYLQKFLSPQSASQQAE